MSELYQQLGLSRTEYEAIAVLQGRQPTSVELAVFSRIWSERCGRGQSRPLLNRLPSAGKRVLKGPGQSAGVVDIGGGLAVALKSAGRDDLAAAPSQAARLGVAQVVRDVFTTGARPVACLDSLRFGEITPSWAAPKCVLGPADERLAPSCFVPAAGSDSPIGDASGAAGSRSQGTASGYQQQRELLEQAVAAAAGYARGAGVPIAGGEVHFDEAYRQHPLFDVLGVGIVKHDEMARVVLGGAGNLLAVIGGKAGQHGIDEPDGAIDKELLECCLELVRSRKVVGLESLGAAGIACTAVEMAAEVEMGIDLWADELPRGEVDVEPWQVIIGGSPGRVLAVVEPEGWEEVREACDRWDLSCSRVGVVTDSGRLRVFWRGEVMGQLPVGVVDAAPVRRVSPERPAHECGGGVSLAAYPPPPATAGEILLDLLGSPDIAGRHWLRQQQSGRQPGLPPLGPLNVGTALLPLRAAGHGLAVSVGGNGRRSYLSPYRGAKEAVATAARRLSCLGATPVAMTGCLHFGNPDSSAVASQSSETVDGIAEASIAVGSPVVSSDISFAPEGDEKLFPTPVVGMLGLLENEQLAPRPYFREEGDLVVLLGGAIPQVDASEYQKRWYGRLEGIIPDVDLRAELQLQEVVREAVKSNLAHSAHDCSDGGLAVALAQCCLEGMGARLNLNRLPGADTYEGDVRTDIALFGEVATRVLLTVPPGGLNELEKLSNQREVPLLVLGTAGGDTLTFEIRGEQVGVPVAALVDTYTSGLLRAIH